MLSTKHYTLLTLLICFIFSSACNYNKKNKEPLVNIKTTIGMIKVKLYNETPLHRDNFLKLVKSKFYDGLTFHRVINHFMIQTGDPSTRQNPKGLSENSDLAEYTVPAEFRSFLFHKKGSLAAARKGDEENPDKESSGSQFYFVQGKILNDIQLNQLEQRINNIKKQSIFFKNINIEKEKAFEKDEALDHAKIQEAAALKTEEEFAKLTHYIIPENHRSVYKTIGGTPHLDGSYTVFGEIVEGLELIDKIASVKTDDFDRPLENIIIIKMKRVRK